MTRSTIIRIIKNMRILNDGKIKSILRCPMCGAGMCVDATSLKCLGARTHCYDFSSSGYVNFCSPSQSGGGDSKAAVRARSTFLNGGYYERVAEAIANICREYAGGGVVLDAGCGEGYYSQLVCCEGMSVFGIDMSKFAVDAASKRLGRNSGDNFFFSAASVFEVPVFDKSFDAIINVFAPCAEKEFARVLKDNGALIVAWAGEKHLLGLKKAIYSNTHENTERADLPRDMTEIARERVSYTVELTSQEQIMNLFAMTPYYWRTSASDIKKLRGLTRLTTEVDIIISVYKR